MTRIPEDAPWIWNLTHGTKEPLYRKENLLLENRFGVDRLEGEGVGRTGIGGYSVQVLALGVNVQ